MSFFGVSTSFGSNDSDAASVQPDGAASTIVNPFAAAVPSSTSVAQPAGGEMEATTMPAVSFNPGYRFACRRPTQLAAHFWSVHNGHTNLRQASNNVVSAGGPTPDAHSTGSCGGLHATGQRGGISHLFPAHSTGGGARVDALGPDHRVRRIADTEAHTPLRDSDPGRAAHASRSPVAALSGSFASAISPLQPAAAPSIWHECRSPRERW
jgi:hypothetical protein